MTMSSTSSEGNLSDFSSTKETSNEEVASSASDLRTRVSSSDDHVDVVSSEGIVSASKEVISSDEDVVSSDEDVVI